MSNTSIDISHILLTVQFSGTITFKSSFNDIPIIIVTLLVCLYPCKFKLRGAAIKISWRNHKRGQAKVVIGSV